jgi:hypothetical protein
MRALPVFVVGLSVLLAGGCGSGSGTPAEDEVRSAWRTAADAVADGSATSFCSLVSAEGKREIARRTGGLDCESAVRLLGSRLSATDKDAIRSAEITEIEVRGDDATVSYESSGALAEVGFTGRTTMRKVGGRWLLSGL